MAVVINVPGKKGELFGSSGIRQLMGKELVQLALNVGITTGNHYRHVIVGCDTRTSAQAVKQAFVAGLLTAGARVFDAGVLPTPTLAFAANRFDAAAMITASHNPPEYNGIKLLNPDGSAFDAKQRAQIEEAISTDTFSAARWDEVRSSYLYSGAIGMHIKRILSDFPGQRRLKVIIDPGGGAAYRTTSLLLSKMGCEIALINSYPNGFFPRPPEPVEENLHELCRTTQQLGADLGIAHDGDADRMMVVDDRGRFISGDKLLVIFAKEAGAKRIVTTVDASMVIDEIGLNVTRTKVGDIYVSEELLKGGSFGGEPSGAWIFPGISLCPDGIYAAARIVDIASRSKISTLADAIPAYPILRASLPRNEHTWNNICERLSALGLWLETDLDGLKFNFDGGWVLIRNSGTEPKIRITTEAKSEELLQQVHNDVIKAVTTC